MQSFGCSQINEGCAEACKKLANHWKTVHLLASFLLARCWNMLVLLREKRRTLNLFLLLVFFSLSLPSLLPSWRNWSDKNSPLGSVVFPAWVEIEIVSIIGGKALLFVIVRSRIFGSWLPARFWYSGKRHNACTHFYETCLMDVF